MKNQVTDQLFYYDNYRTFLRDYFREQKRLKSFFSFRYFARKAGFASSSFCAHVIEGKRNLTQKSMARMLRGLGLSGKAARIFEALVFYNQAKSVEDRESCFRSLQKLRKSSRLYKINKAQYAYYDHWYYPVVRELAVHSDWKGNFTQLASLTVPPITTGEARKAVETLVAIGMLVPGKNGSFSQSSEAVSAEEVPSSITRGMKKELILKSIESFETMPRNTRHIAGVTLSMSQKTFAAVMENLEDIRKQVLADALDDNEVEGVYQVNIQAFPLSRPFRSHRETQER